MPQDLTFWGILFLYSINIQIYKRHSASSRFIGYFMMRRSERPPGHQCGMIINLTGNGMDLGCYKYLFERQWRHDCRQSFGQHGFTGLNLRVPLKKSATSGSPTRKKRIPLDTFTSIVTVTASIPLTELANVLTDIILSLVALMETLIKYSKIKIKVEILLRPDKSGLRRMKRVEGGCNFKEIIIV